MGLIDECPADQLLREIKQKRGLPSSRSSQDEQFSHRLIIGIQNPRTWCEVSFTTLRKPEQKIRDIAHDIGSSRKSQFDPGNAMQGLIEQFFSTIVAGGAA